jgi:hypothetical protein
MPNELPSRQIDELKTLVYSYVTLGPLVAALFANRIDNVFAACFLFVCFVGAAFLGIRKRMDTLEQSVRDQEARLEKLSQLLQPAHEEEWDAPG